MNSFVPPVRRRAIALGAACVLLFCASTALAQGFGRNKIQYRNFDWQVLSTPHFEIFFYDQELAARAALIAEDAYTRLSKTLRHDLGSQIPFILYSSPNDFQQTNISDELIGEGTGGFSEPARNRVVLPFPGDDAGFIHVINHELVHVFMFDIAFHSTAKGAARRAFFPIPLWFAEGAAEWFSSGWDKQSEMWVRDATVYDWLVPLEYLSGGFQVYKEGQAAMRYMAQTYGDEKVVDFFKAVGRTRDVERALQEVVGLDEEKFSERWVKAMKQEYWPLYSNKQEAEAVGRRLTDHEKERAYFSQQPSLSPDGRHIAFFSDRDDLVDLFLMNAADGKIVRKLVTGYKSNRFLTLHSFESSIGFSPDGDRLCFVAKSGAHETLYVVRVSDGKILKDIPLDMDIARSPAWSPRGDQVVLSGAVAGQTDLYLIDLEGGNVSKLTDDVADEASPAWYPTGDRILYSAYPNSTTRVEFTRDERGRLRLQPIDFTSDQNVDRDGNSYDLWAMDLTTREASLVVATPGNDTDPVAVDDETIVFVSDLSGISNLYTHDLQSRRTHRFTDVLGGLFHPTVSAAADRLVFCAFNKGGFDLFMTENFRGYSSEHRYADPLDAKTAALAAGALDDSGSVALALLKGATSTSSDGPTAPLEQVATVDRVGASDLPAPAPGGPADSEERADTADGAVASDVAEDAPPSGGPRSGEPPPGGEPGDAPLPAGEAAWDGTGTGDAVADSARAPRPAAGAAPGRSRPPAARRPIGTVERYSPRFSLDPIGGGGLGGIYYSTGVGLGLANIISFSDLLGNHRMQFLVNFYGSLKYSDLAASYYYLKRRVNYGFGVFHYRNYINSNYTSLGEVFERSRLFTERNYGVFGLASMPFTQFDRLDVELQAFTSDRTFYRIDQDGFVYETSSSSAQLIQPSATYVHDTAFYGAHGPVTGTRYLVSFSPALPLSDSSVKRTTSFVDLRKYAHIWYRNSLAFRVVGATSRGPDPRQFTVGGPGTLRGFDVFDFEELEPGTDQPLYDNLLGRNLVLMNVEYRFPLVDYLIFGWPGRFGLSGIGASVFFDAGSAFDHEFTEFQVFSKGDGPLRLADLNADFGFGIRANVGWLPLKFDWGWKTDLAQTGKPQFNFSIGPEF